MSLRCLGPHIWKTLPENMKEIILKNFLKSINIVVNAVFVITENKYLIKFISPYLIQYSCIIYNTLVCTPAWYDFSDIISLKKMGDGISV